jgi:glycosyltransferase involved in cell wall biosynthesis
MLVSCILPTKNRAAFIPQAIRCYQSQTYPHKELVIIDNGNDGTEALIPPDDPSIRYGRVAGKRTTGDMRNLCARYAKGEIICHFDSDDWSAPERVTDQVTRLGEFGVLTGYHDMLFYDVRDGRLYHWHMRSPNWFALGTSLCYRRDWWRGHPFVSLQIGEDIRFFRQAAREAKRFVSSVSGGHMMVARVHDYQTSKKSLTKMSYTPMPPTELPSAFPCGSTLSAI